MREWMDEDHKKKMREAGEQARAEILNNVSASGTNDAVPDVSMPIPMRELFDEKKTRMMGIDPTDKDREKEEMRRAMK